MSKLANDLMTCDTAAEMLTFLLSAYDLSQPLTKTQKEILAKGLAQGLSFTNAKRR